MIFKNQIYLSLLISAALLSACGKSESVKSLPSQNRETAQDRAAHDLSDQERDVHVLETLVKEYERLTATATVGQDDAKMGSLITALRLLVEKLPHESDLSEAGKFSRARAVWICNLNRRDELPLN
jgi:hypothetical protein